MKSNASKMKSEQNLKTVYNGQFINFFWINSFRKLRNVLHFAQDDVSNSKKSRTKA